ncbi:MAG TPA: ATP-binding protein, partial [Candidatus Woesebacteria bacterium]|nr:ATP-binding protein [Candidatus Woesebacteria bacterium]
CKCGVNQIANYQKKLSGPIMDRIDIHLTVPAVETEKLAIDAEKVNCEDSITVRKRVIKARNIQKNRFEGLANIHTNSDMKNIHLKKFANLEDKANLLLKMAINKFGLSARTYFRLIKVSRTIADLDESDHILEKHIAEALQFRVKSEYL